MSQAYDEGFALGVTGKAPENPYAFTDYEKEQEWDKGYWDGRRKNVPAPEKLIWRSNGITEYLTTVPSDHELVKGEYPYKGS